MAEVSVPRSTVEIKFWTPPTVLLLTVVGGPKSWLNVTVISTVQWQVHRWMVDGAFRTPLIVLLLTVGGGGGVMKVG
jgi:hypothetical protein